MKVICSHGKNRSHKISFATLRVSKDYTKPYSIMEKGRTMVDIHNYGATSFIYVNVPALFVFASDFEVVVVEAGTSAHI